MSKNVFISYCWHEPSNGIVCNWLCESLKSHSIDYVLDKNDCVYGDSIDEFERSIGSADKVIVVASRDYIQSEACMYEASMIISRGNLKKRIIPINVDDFGRECDDYLNISIFWVNEYKKKKELYDKMPEQMKGYVKTELEKTELIINNFEKFWKFFHDINTLSFIGVSKNCFKVLIDMINEGELHINNNDTNKITGVDMQLPT